MVSIAASGSEISEQLTAGLNAEDSARVLEALAFIKPIYETKTVVTGQDAFLFAQGVATTLAHLKTDVDTRIAGLLFELPAIDATAADSIEARFGKEIADLVAGIRQLIRLHEVTFGQQEVSRGKNAAQQASAQLETLRKMLLAMASDMRVVLVRLGSRVTTLRYYADLKLEND
ncbi:MAG TPA: GTP pyrophosphokinase, partial [Oxalobacteraceae bacterium]|nr:GTP pyrophosphokinase [Oxalobacteraceae bacterium]